MKVERTPSGRPAVPGGAFRMNGSMQSYQVMRIVFSSDSMISTVVERGSPPAGEHRRAHRDPLVGERRMQQRLDRALQPACHRDVVAVDVHLPFGQFALHEQGVPGAGRTPQHPPVAGAVGHRLSAVVAEANEGVLAGHQDLMGVDGGHVCILTVRAAQRAASLHRITADRPGRRLSRLRDGPLTAVGPSRRPRNRRRSRHAPASCQPNHAVIRTARNRVSAGAGSGDA